MAVARASVVLLAALGVLATLAMPSISGAWKFLASISAGTGLIVLLRWLWWRINAWSEIGVMAASLLLANALLLFTDIPFPFSFALVVAISVPFALALTFLTSPEEPAHLRAFYERVRPAGWWRPVAAALGEEARPLGARPWVEVVCATVGVYALLLGTGGLLLGRSVLGWGGLGVGLSTLLALVLASAGRRKRVVT